MKQYYHVITERNDEYISTVAVAENRESVKAHFASQNVREIIELNAAQANTISAAAATTIIDLTAEQPQTVTHDYTTLADTIRAELNARHDRSAWNKAVTLYALDLLEISSGTPTTQSACPLTVQSLSGGRSTVQAAGSSTATAAAPSATTPILPPVSAPRPNSSAPTAA